MDRQTERQTDGLMDGKTAGAHINAWMDKLMGRSIKRRMCGLLDKLTRRLRHGSIGQKDEQA
jgi:hypothetical protein